MARIQRDPHASGKRRGGGKIRSPVQPMADIFVVLGKDHADCGVARENLEDTLDDCSGSEQVLQQEPPPGRQQRRHAATSSNEDAVPAHASRCGFAKAHQFRRDVPAPVRTTRDRAPGHRSTEWKREAMSIPFLFTVRRDEQAGRHRNMAQIVLDLLHNLEVIDVADRPRATRAARTEPADRRRAQPRCSRLFGPAHIAWRSGVSRSPGPGARLALASGTRSRTCCTVRKASSEHDSSQRFRAFSRNVSHRAGSR